MKYLLIGTGLFLVLALGWEYYGKARWYANAAKGRRFDGITLLVAISAGLIFRRALDSGADRIGIAVLYILLISVTIIVRHRKK